MKILIVDDLLENRKLMLNLLAGYGECDVVASGQEALDLFEASILDAAQYDVVLLDIMMPVMDGHEVLRSMRAQEAEHGLAGENESAIIMVTAAASPRHVLDAFFKGGCTDYIEKPVSLDTLLGKFRECRLLED
jgi:two-component system, chemotaxis family, chemotaxis protein CheY